jgi:hypothetical protein
VGAAVMKNSRRSRSEKLVKTEHLSEKLTKPNSNLDHEGASRVLPKERADMLCRASSRPAWQKSGCSGLQSETTHYHLRPHRSCE